jgi:hypothetical protein
MYLRRVGINCHSYAAACSADVLRIEYVRTVVSREINEGWIALPQRTQIEKKKLAMRKSSVPPLVPTPESLLILGYF